MFSYYSVFTRSVVHHDYVNKYIDRCMDWLIRLVWDSAEVLSGVSLKVFQSAIWISTFFFLCHYSCVNLASIIHGSALIFHPF